MGQRIKLITDLELKWLPNLVKLAKESLKTRSATEKEKRLSRQHRRIPLNLHGNVRACDGWIENRECRGKSHSLHLHLLAVRSRQCKSLRLPQRIMEDLKVVYTRRDSCEFDRPIQGGCPWKERAAT